MLLLVTFIPVTTRLYGDHIGDVINEHVHEIARFYGLNVVAIVASFGLASFEARDQNHTQSNRWRLGIFSLTLTGCILLVITFSLDQWPQPVLLILLSFGLLTPFAVSYWRHRRSGQDRKSFPLLLSFAVSLFLIRLLSDNRPQAMGIVLLAIAIIIVTVGVIFSRAPNGQQEVNS